MRILLTGASGFVGQGLLAALDQAGHQVTACARQLRPDSHYPLLAGPELGPYADWRPLLAGQQVVIHCAGRVHVMREQAARPLEAFRRVNVQGSWRLARQAAAAGVQRFIFLSSIKVNGEASQPGQPWQACDRPVPADAYGQSKYEVERLLQRLAADTGMAVTVIRPVLVYGPGVKANFRRLLGWLARGWPLPLGAVDNRRSLLALDNLADLVVRCCSHPAAANQVFLASDGQDLSTPELLRLLGEGLGRPARLWPVPLPLLEGAARLLGREAWLERLCGSLQVDIRKTCSLLDWQPPVAATEALQATARAFLQPGASR